MLKKKLILITLSTICIQNSFAMEPENDKYSLALRTYKSAENIGNADVAAEYLEEVIKLKSQKTTQTTNNNNDDINFFDEYTKLALEFRRQGKEKQAIDCDNCAERFRTKGWVEWAAVGVSYGWEKTTGAASSLLNNRAAIIGGITAIVEIVNTISNISNAANTISNAATTISNSNLPGGGTPAPSVQPKITKVKVSKQKSKGMQTL